MDPPAGWTGRDLWKNPTSGVGYIVPVMTLKEQVRGEWVCLLSLKAFLLVHA